MIMQIFAFLKDPSYYDFIIDFIIYVTDGKSHVYKHMLTKKQTTT